MCRLGCTHPFFRLTRSSAEGTYATTKPAFGFCGVAGIDGEPHVWARSARTVARHRVKVSLVFTVPTAWPHGSCESLWSGQKLIMLNWRLRTLSTCGRAGRSSNDTWPACLTFLIRKFWHVNTLSEYGEGAVANADNASACAWKEGRVSIVENHDRNRSAVDVQ